MGEELFLYVFYLGYDFQMNVFAYSLDNAVDLLLEEFSDKEWINLKKEDIDFTDIKKHRVSVGVKDFDDGLELN